MSELRREEEQRERIPTKVHATALDGALGFLRGASVTRPRFRRLAGSTCRFSASAGPVTSASTSRDATDSSGLRREALGRNLQGCRIGFDLGGSDRKVAAVIDGAVVFSEEIPWSPYFQSDPQYHLDGVQHSLTQAAAHLPRVDAIGGSAAGTYVNNEVRAASLFRGVSPEDFERRIRRMFFTLREHWNP